MVLQWMVRLAAKQSISNSGIREPFTPSGSFSRKSHSPQYKQGYTNSKSALAAGYCCKYMFAWLRQDESTPIRGNFEIDRGQRVPQLLTVKDLNPDGPRGTPNRAYH
jgi:hypothetical protein